MANNYKMNSENIQAAAKRLNNALSDLSANIKKLNSLISEIENSSDWTDATLKPAFINSAKTYAQFYKDVYGGLKGYKNYLQKKAEDSDEIEGAFSA